MMIVLMRESTASRPCSLTRADCRPEPSVISNKGHDF